MKRFVSRVAILAVACCGVTESIAWCGDGKPLTPSQELAKSPLVFVGTVTSARDTPPPRPRWDPGTTYTFRVTEVLRGPPQSTVDVFSERNSAGLYLDEGTSYLVFAFRREGVLTASGCGNSGELQQ